MMSPDLSHHPNFAYVPVIERSKRRVVKHFLVGPTQAPKDVDFRAQLKRWGAVLIDQGRQHGRMTIKEALVVYEKAVTRKELTVAGIEYRQNLELAIETLYFKRSKEICWCDECPLVVSLQQITTDLRRTFPNASEPAIAATESRLRADMLAWRRGEGLIFTQRYRCKWFKCSKLFWPNASNAFPYCGLPHRNAAKKRFGWYWDQLKSNHLSKRFKKSCRTCGKTFWGNGRAARCQLCINASMKPKRKRAKRKTVKTVKRTVRTRRKKCGTCGELFVPTNKRQKYCNDGCRKAANRGKRKSGV